jgi:hypothetical protein
MRMGMTYKSHPASVDEWFGREPFPHERARGFIVDRVDQPANVVVNCPKGIESIFFKEIRIPCCMVNVKW